MKVFSLILVVGMMAGGCGGTQTSSSQTPAPKTNENQEPPQIFFLEFDGKKTPIQLDKPFGTAILGSTKEFTLRVEPYRNFQLANVRFNYPREYTFEANLKGGLSSWMLAGTSCTITVSRLRDWKNHETALEKMVKALLAANKNNKANESPVKRIVRGEELNGKRIEVIHGSVILRQDLYSFSSGQDSVVLIVQDTPQDDGSPSTDTRRGEKMLWETLQLPGK